MKAHVALHVRERPGGPAVVTPLPFVELAYEAETAAAATDALRPALTQRLQELEPVDRLPHADPPAATLMRVPVQVEVGGKGGERVEIAVGVVALARVARGRPVVVCHVPVLANFELVGSDGDLEALAARLATAIAKRLKSWSATAVLNADEPGDSRLVVVELELDEGGSRDEYGDDGPSEGILDELAIDLTRREGGRIDGRDELVQRVLETLSAGGRSSVLLIGPPDVGKTALVHEIVSRIAGDAAPPALRGRRVWRISANELIAGAQYTGQWQDRARQLIDQARRTRAIVFMGDPVEIIDAGRWSRSDNNVSRYLRPYVETGDVTLVCECTADQLAAAQKQEPSFVGAFHRVDVAEPTKDESLAIAAAAAARLGGTTSCAIEADAVEAAVELTGRFEPYRSFPGKAIRLLEDAVREREDGVAGLDRADVTAAFVRRSGMPLALLSDRVTLRMADVREHFESRILGQPEATATVVDLVAVLKAGLNDPQKPLGSFFFVGPTGVGKTELAKALAEFLFGSRDRLLRFDMGEYASADAVQRLIGTAWGKGEGELTRRVREQPFCVVLLDEIEKAHSSVFDALLAAIGEGRLTDAAGRVADFHNAIVIMTSNLGAARVRSAALGFGSEASAGGDGVQRRYVEEAERFFRPEFFNRIDRIVVFHALTRQTVRQIARRELGRLLVREGIVRRRLLVEVDDAVVDAVAGAGFHPRYGARPLQREIERAVIQPLARLLVDRRPRGGDFVRVHLADGRISVDIEHVSEPEPRAPRTERRATHSDATFAKAERRAAAFAEELAADASSTLADEVRAVVSELVESTHEPSFWDDAARARGTLQRIYRLEHVLDRLDALRERAAGLTEMARRVREARDRARLAEIPRALEEMEDLLVVLRLELAAAAASAERGAAVVRVVAVGGGATRWAEQVLAMYAAWADRTAREATPVGDGAVSLRIEGLATLDLLAGESGLHRHVLPDRTEELARVVVEAPGGGASTDDDAGVVVRVYEEGRRRVVRDPRTGVRASHVAAVLDDGHIDPFLIAALRSPPAAATA